jgi:hypothetical protein
MVSRFLGGIEPMPAKNETHFRHLKPAENDYKRSDSGGLFMLVTKTGSKLWRYGYSSDRKQKLLATRLRSTVGAVFRFAIAVFNFVFGSAMCVSSAYPQVASADRYCGRWHSGVLNLLPGRRLHEAVFVSARSAWRSRGVFFVRSRSSRPSNRQRSVRSQV